MSATAQTQAIRQPVLEMRHISKTFGAIRALQDVSTLMKVLSGVCRPDAGRAPPHRR